MPAPVAAGKRTPIDGVFPEVEPFEAKIQVFLSAPLPAAGVSPSFDACRQYPSAKALQMILRRALDGYEIRLEDGSHGTAPRIIRLASPRVG